VGEDFDAGVVAAMLRLPVVTRGSRAGAGERDGDRSLSLVTFPRLDAGTAEGAWDDTGEADAGLRRAR